MHTVEGRAELRLLNLPPIAKKKFAALKALVEDSEALTRVALGRERALEDLVYDAQRRRSICNPTDEPERAKHLTIEVEELQAESQRLHSDRMKRESIRGNATQILSQLRFNFLAAEDFAFPQVRPCTRAPAHPRDGEDLKAAIVRVRRAISDAQAELVRVKQAPCTPEEARAAIIAEVNRLAAIGKPTLQFNGPKIAIHFPDQQQHSMPGQALVAPSGAASAMMCWLFADQIIQHATANLDQIVGGISTPDRKRMIGELEAELAALEHDEESLITQGLDGGLEVHRRPFASPYAILGIEVVPPLIEAAPTPQQRRRLNGNTREDNDAAHQAAE
jgi:hypothetical protein